MSRAQSGRHRDGGGGGEAERIRAGDDNGGDGEGERQAHALAADEVPEEERRDARRDGEDDEPLRRLVREPLGGGLGVLGGAHQCDDLGERRVATHLGRPEGDSTFMSRVRVLSAAHAPLWKTQPPQSTTVVASRKSQISRRSGCGRLKPKRCLPISEYSTVGMVRMRERKKRLRMSTAIAPAIAGSLMS